jgi:hypothetical protein
MSSEIIHIEAYDNFDDFEDGGSHVQHQWPPQLWKWDGIFLQMCIEGKFILNFLYACAIVIRSSIEVCTMYKTLVVK